MGSGDLLFEALPVGRPGAAKGVKAWAPTRAAGLDALRKFAPRAGRAYAARRNYDFGPEDRSNVSALSPWLRHRILTEAETLEAILARHSAETAEKFIQEVFWRGYFKGWLERRPAVWAAYRAGVASDLDALTTERRSAYQAALAGRTGIEGFDDWARELVETGWLHNHARMWFASIWIFTLRLPWRLGADFFLRHLMDGDPASNTLSWRWVAGLHTRGKTYLARRDNIARYTEGRFSPAGLSPVAEPLDEAPHPAAAPAPTGVAAPREPFGLLLTADDLHPESLRLAAPPAAVMALPSVEGRSPLAVGACAADFEAAALADAATRAAARFGVAAETGTDDWGDALVGWAARANLSAIAVARPPVGPAAERLAAAAPALREAGVALYPVMRRYDELVWPHAHKGFFAVKKKIPHLLDELGLT